MGNDIGPLPDVEHPRRRQRALKDLEYFLRTYFPAAFTWSWSADHLRIIEALGQAIISGGQRLILMPRKSGKTAIAVRAALWAGITGHQRFSLIVGSSAEAAATCQADVLTELIGNEHLGADFPEVCHPLRQLGGMQARAKLQQLGGVPTRCSITDPIVLPTITLPGLDQASGSRLQLAGIESKSLRGTHYTGLDGTVHRPGFILIDDPQDDDSARSYSQSAKRHDVIRSIQAMTGNKATIVACCTAIAQNDLTARLRASPGWQVFITRMVNTWPTNTELWDQWRAAYDAGVAANRGVADANKFYRRHRPELDVGAAVAWPDRIERGGTSAIETVMILQHLLGPERFAAEYQNQPPDPSGLATDLRIRQIVGNNLPRRTLPLEAEYVTAMIDVHNALLYYAVLAWPDTGDRQAWLVDYGTWPEQPRTGFSLANAGKRLEDLYPQRTPDARITAAVADLINGLSSSAWTREDGAEIYISRGHVDYGYLPDKVLAGIKRSSYQKLWTGTRGKGLRPTDRQMADWKRQPGERFGDHWRLSAWRQGRDRELLFDANYWKTLLARAMLTPGGDPGGLSVFAGNHSDLLAHCQAEQAVEADAAGLRGYVWHQPKGCGDQHWWDCLVGAYIAGHILTGPTVRRHRAAPAEPEPAQARAVELTETVVEF
jgi:hypothetical protein